MAKRTVTINDIAEYLAISKATVSYVLNGKARKVGVSEQTSRRVADAARKLGYVPNHWARTLRGRRTGIISVFFDTLIMGWSQRVMEGIEKVLLDKEYSATIYAHTDTVSRDERFLRSEEKKILSVLERRDEGVICQVIPQMKDQYFRLVEANVPLVFLNEIEDMADFEGVDKVTWDSGPAAEVAVRHLISQGYRKIGYYGLQLEVRSCRERLGAFRSVMDEAGLEVYEDWIINQTATSPLPPYTDLVTQLRELLSGGGPRPEAFFVMNDYLAIHVIGLLKEMGIKIPGDIALIGMGELDVSPVAGLSTVREPLREMGAASAQMILNRIDNPYLKPVHEKITCNDLIVRDSTLPK